MKRIALAFAAFVAYAMFVLGALAAPEDTCTITPNVGPEWNHVWFNITCDPNMVADEWIHLQFGDGSETDVWVHSDGHGDDSEHWYPYPGGIFEVVATRLSNGEFLGSLTLELFPETPAPTATPPVPAPTATPPIPAPPTCEIQQEEGDVINHINFVFSCENFVDQWATVDFGDGSETDVWVDESGQAMTDHAYEYAVGGLTTYNGYLGIEVEQGIIGFPFEVVIDDQPQQIYLPMITRD